MLLNCGAGEDSWESLDCKEIKPVNTKGNQPWIFIGKTDAKAEAPVLWSPDVKSWLTVNPDAGKDWRQMRRGRQRMKWLDSVTDSMDMNLSKLSEIVEGRGAWCATLLGVAKSQTQFNDWTIATIHLCGQYNNIKYKNKNKVYITLIPCFPIV